MECNGELGGRQPGVYSTYRVGGGGHPLTVGNYTKDHTRLASGDRYCTYDPWYLGAPLEGDSSPDQCFLNMVIQGGKWLSPKVLGGQPYFLSSTVSAVYH